MDFWFWLFLALTLLAGLAAAVFKRALLLPPLVGAVAGLVLAALPTVRWYFELLSFVLGLALAALVVFLLPRRRLSPLEAMVGRRCTVTERIEPLTGGQVTVDGNLWAARALSSEVALEVGAELSVVAIEGVKLICA